MSSFVTLFPTLSLYTWASNVSKFISRLEPRHRHGLESKFDRTILMLLSSEAQDKAPTQVGAIESHM